MGLAGVARTLYPSAIQARPRERVALVNAALARGMHESY